MIIFKIVDFFLLACFKPSSKLGETVSRQGTTVDLDNEAFEPTEQRDKKLIVIAIYFEK